ncbi:MAG: hypothetical protein ACJAW3_001521 [Lentimonas sp.]|jgi:hypothetical protein
MDRYESDVNRINKKRDTMLSLRDQQFQPQELRKRPQRAIQGRPPLPENMFFISYNLNNFPYSYKPRTISFDNIKIPQRDIFGTRSRLGEKEYQLIDQKILQRDIDFMKESQNEAEFKGLTKDLIREEKQRRKMKFVNKNQDSSNENY